MLENIKISQLTASKTNPRGAHGFKGPEFNDLVQSIKEKGVLVPILVRAIKGSKYEVIAGNRRYEAAKIAGLTEMPAQVMKMNDSEAREAQIVENLQRKDVHPIEEGEAFRYLVEELNHDVIDVSKRVGKSERFVRDRLALTNLSKAARKAFMADKINVTVAIMLAKIDSPKVAKEALERAIRYDWDGESLRKFIADEMFKIYNGKPWAKDAKLSEMLGDVKRATLFNADPEHVEDPVEHARMMAAYIALQIQKAAAKGVKMIKISTGYGAPSEKGVLGRDEYRILETKADRKAAKETIQGIVVEGYDKMGRVFTITTEKPEVKNGKTAPHKLTPKEIEKRRLAREAEEKAQQDLFATINKALNKIVFPLTSERLDDLYRLVFDVTNTTEMQRMCARYGMKYVKVEHDGYTTKDYATPLKEMAEKDGDTGKLRMIFDLLSASPYNDQHQADRLKKI